MTSETGPREEPVAPTALEDRAMAYRFAHAHHHLLHAALHGPRGVEPGAAGSREVAFRFVFVEALPPVHGHVGRPVEDSQVEAAGLGDHGALESTRADRPIVRDRWSRRTS